MAKSPGSILKRKGLIPKDWNLKELTNYKRKKINRLARQYSELIQKPQTFTIRKVGRKTVPLLERAGYRVENQRAIIPLVGTAAGAKVRIKANKIYIRKGDRTETVYLASNPDFLKSLPKLAGQELGPDEYWAFKIGEHNTFLRNHHQDLRELLNYGKYGLKLENDELASMVSLVKVKMDPFDHRIIEETPLNARQLAYKKRRQAWARKQIRDAE